MEKFRTWKCISSEFAIKMKRAADKEMSPREVYNLIKRFTNELSYSIEWMEEIEGMTAAEIKTAQYLWDENWMVEE